MCYSTTLKTHKDKFELRTKSHIFVGYPLDIKGYKVLDLETMKIHISRDFQFHESVFPFAISSNHSAFPSMLKLVHVEPICLEPMGKTLDEHESVSRYVTNTHVSRRREEPATKNTSDNSTDNGTPSNALNLPTDYVNNQLL